MSFEYSDAVKNGCLDVIRATVDEGVAAGAIHVADESGALLVVATLDDPATTHDTDNVRLTFNLVTSTVQAIGSGRAASARLMNGNMELVLAMPCAEGNSPVSGYCVLDSLDVIEGVDVEFAAPVIASGRLWVRRGHRHTHLARQRFNGLHEAHVLGLAQEGQRIPLRVAAEAIVKPLAVIDMKRGRALLVKGAWRPEITLAGV